MEDFQILVHTTLHPDRLWIWRQSVYVDENQRTWLPISIEVRPPWRPAGQGSMGGTIAGQALVPGAPQADGGPGGAPRVPQGERERQEARRV